MLLMLVLLASVAAQAGEATPPAAAAAPTIEQRIAQASGIGGMLYAFDRAAWVSSDALTATVPKERLARLAAMWSKLSILRSCASLIIAAR